MDENFFTISKGVFLGIQLYCSSLGISAGCRIGMVLAEQYLSCNNAASWGEATWGKLADS